MNTFDLDEVTAILLASGWHRPDSRTLHRQTGTYWIDGQPTPMLRWTENGAPVYVPAANVLAVRSTKPPEPEVPVEPVAPPLDMGGRPSFSSDSAARSNRLLVGRPAAL